MMAEHYTLEIILLCATVVIIVAIWGLVRLFYGEDE
jgi:hypothetical protein